MKPRGLYYAVLWFKTIAGIESPLLNGAGTQNAGNANYTSVSSSIAICAYQWWSSPDSIGSSDYNWRHKIQTTIEFGNQTKLTTGLAVRLQTVGGSNQKDLSVWRKIKAIFQPILTGADITPLNDSAAATRAVNIWLPLFLQTQLICEQIAVVRAKRKHYCFWSVLLASLWKSLLVGLGHETHKIIKPRLFGRGLSVANPLIQPSDLLQTSPDVFVLGGSHLWNECVSGWWNK